MGFNSGFKGLKGLDHVKCGVQTGGAVRFGRKWILAGLAADKLFNIVRQQINKFVKFYLSFGLLPEKDSILLIEALLLSFYITAIYSQITVSTSRKSVLIYIQQDATLHSLFCLETALHVSSDTTTNYQERKQLYLQHPVFVTPLLLSAAIVE